MAVDPVDALGEWLLDRLGEDLRTVVTVRDDGGEIEYLREDLRAAYDQESYSEVVHAFRESRREPPYDFEDYPLGGQRAVVYHHENGRVVQLRGPDGGPVSFSVEPGTRAPDHELVAGALERLNGAA